MELYNADCLEKLKDLSDKSVDCVILDLPYGTTNCHWDTKIDLSKLWEQLLRVGKERTAYFFFCDFRFGAELVNSNPKLFKGDLVWDKQKAANPLLTLKRIGHSHENILVFYKKPPVFQWDKYHGIAPKQPKTNMISFDGCFRSNRAVIPRIYEPRLPLSVMEFSKVWGKKRKHPTEKPIALLEHLIKYHTAEDEVVLDPTMGSGTTGQACKNLGRRFIGIEIDKAIYDTAVERLATEEEKSDTI
jgi:site-specific DNA-methyltransferase (adenine-specific)